MRKFRLRLLISAFFFSAAILLGEAQAKPRARDLGIPFDGTPGPLNAITDVQGVEVGHTTLISGEGKLQVGVGPVRTGVTAILPRGTNFEEQVIGAWFKLMVNGSLDGTTRVSDFVIYARWE